MVETLRATFLNFWVNTVDEHGAGEEQGADEIKEFIMHHVQDHVIYPIQILGFDISITKHVIMIWIAAVVLIIAIPLIVRSKALIPKGPANFIEWVIVFLKDSVIQPFLGDDGFKYAPYLLTAFFFVITCKNSFRHFCLTDRELDFASVFFCFGAF